MDISIIIVNYNTFELTCQCINSVLTYLDESDYEIILVDNASKEVNPDQFKITFPQIKLIKLEENYGFGIANNIGMTKALGEFFMLLNSDAYFIDTSPKYLLHEAKENPKFKVFGCTMLNEDLTFQKTFYPKLDLDVFNVTKLLVFSNPLLKQLFQFKKEKVEEDIPDEVGGLYGSFVFLQREVFEQTGGFDPDFFMYSEDIEWFRNRIAKRYRTKICKSARIVHLGSGSSPDQLKKQSILSHFLYWYKIGLVQYVLFTLVSLLNCITSLLLLPFMRKIERRRNLIHSKYLFHLLPQIVLDIPKYSNKFGSRKSVLKVW